PRLEAKRLAHLGQEAGQERRPLAAPRHRAEAARRALALDQGPCRPRRKRARRPARARGRGDGEVAGVALPSATAAVIARLDRATQYAVASRLVTDVSGILDRPLSRAMTVVNEAKALSSVMAGLDPAI